MSKKHQKILCTLLIALNLALIWGNSAMTGEESGSLSAWVQQFLSFLPQSDLWEHILRKIAHFSEFALLGILMAWMCVLVKERTYPSILGLGLTCACIDETIQYYVPGRASMLLDVWIDFAGFATGLALLTIGYTICKRKHHLEDTKR